MKKVPAPQVATTAEAPESTLPPADPGGAGRAGRGSEGGAAGAERRRRPGVVHELMEAEVTEVVGPKGKWNPGRTAKRHGHEDGSLTLGARRVKVRRPRMRSAEAEHELPLGTYEHFADCDPGR